MQLTVGAEKLLAYYKRQVNALREQNDMLAVTIEQLMEQIRELEGGKDASKGEEAKERQVPRVARRQSVGQGNKQAQGNGTG